MLLTNAAARGAVCLDGTPGGYYIRRGDPARWLIFHQGGGWCSSDDNCADRAQTDLGSSKAWPSTYNDTYCGGELFATPPFDSYTIIFAMYCDGGSWTGNVSEPVRTGNSTVYYRGRRLLDALLDDLLHVQGMSAATELLYGGCSAGALTVYLHADMVGRRMPPATRVRALADAMFALRHHDIAGAPRFEQRMQWGFTAWNASASVNEACLAAQRPGEERSQAERDVAPHCKRPRIVTGRGVPQRAVP